MVKQRWPTQEPAGKKNPAARQRGYVCYCPKGVTQLYSSVAASAQHTGMWSKTPPRPRWWWPWLSSL